MVKICNNCQKEFSAHRLTARFCSESCGKKIYYSKNKLKLQAYGRTYNKEHQEKHLNHSMQYAKKRYHTDLNFRLSQLLRNRLSAAIKQRHKAASAVKDLGCSIDELRKHLESKFQIGMSWDTYGKFGWHIDHVKPLSSFDLSDPVQAKEACHYSNLQPLWWYDNLSKGDKSGT